MKGRGAVEVPMEVATLKAKIQEDIDKLILLAVRQHGGQGMIINYPLLAKRVSDPVWDAHERLAVDEAHHLSGALDLYRGIKSYLEKVPNTLISDEDKKKLFEEELLELGRFLKDCGVLKE